MRLLTMFWINIVVVDCVVDGHYSVAVRDASVTDIGCKSEETEQLKLGYRKAVGEYWGGR